MFPAVNQTLNQPACDYHRGKSDCSFRVEKRYSISADVADTTAVEEDFAVLRLARYVARNRAGHRMMKARGDILAFHRNLFRYDLLRRYFCFNHIELLRGARFQVVKADERPSVLFRINSARYDFNMTVSG